MLITIIQACAISIVLAVGVTNTVSHPFKNISTKVVTSDRRNNLHSMKNTLYRNNHLSCAKAFKICSSLVVKEMNAVISTNLTAQRFRVVSSITQNELG